MSIFKRLLNRLTRSLGRTGPVVAAKASQAPSGTSPITQPPLVAAVGEPVGPSTPASAYDSVVMRRATTADVPFVLELIQQGAGEKHYDGLTLDFINGALIPAINGQKTTKTRPTEHGGSRVVTFEPTLWIAEAPQGTPVAFCLTKGPETPPTHPLYRTGEIWMLSVDRSERGKGHGRRLLSAILEMFPGMPLFARCNPASAAMIAMLRAEGFQQSLVNSVIIMSR